MFINKYESQSRTEIAMYEERTQKREVLEEKKHGSGSPSLRYIARE